MATTCLITTHFALFAFLSLGVCALQALAEEPGPENDYGRSGLGGMRGSIEWESLLKGDALDGWERAGQPFDPDAWSRNDDTIISETGDDGHVARLVYTDQAWKNYEFKVQATFVKGSNLQIPFRITEDGKSFYFLDFLTGYQAVAISMHQADVRGVTKLDVAHFVIEYGREYDIVISVIGQSIRSYIDGKLVNVLTSDLHTRGGIALATWGNNTVVRFRDPKVRHYD